MFLKGISRIGVKTPLVIIGGAHGNGRKDLELMQVLAMIRLL